MCVCINIICINNANIIINLNKSTKHGVCAKWEKDERIFKWKFL